MDEIINFISLKEYEFILDEVQLKASLEIDRTNPPLEVINLDLKRLDLSQIKIEDLFDLIATDSAKIISFILIKLEKYLNKKEVQEYPKGYEPDEADDNIKVLPFYKNFLIPYFIEYYYLKNKPEELCSYLLSLRTPAAKKYDKELKSIYKKINSL
ncbi:hypothetical protein [Flavobacterium hydatis]|uniref:hypothetical protein n=1 Tax=Flavobacterium hydatis TaxID=991 RepID=UPI000B5BF5E8|nr:hypothetical protein [Flavobacterium hydatis]